MNRCALFSALALTIGTLGGCAESDPGLPHEPLERPDTGEDGGSKGDAPDQDQDDVNPDDEPCPAGFLDSLEVESGCEVDPDASWDVTAVSGVFTPQKPDGREWDINGGRPDGYVFITFGYSNYEVETAPDDEKFEPIWSDTLIWAVSTKELRARFEIGLYDNDDWDPTGDDLMAECSFPMPDEAFAQEYVDIQEIVPGCPNVRLGLRLAN